MKAVVYADYGSSDVLQLVDRPRPIPAPDEVLVAVVSAGINPGDWRLRSGQFRLGMRLRLPFIPGSDVAGVVAAVGAEVSGFAVGDTVYAMTPLTRGGGCAEFVAVSVRHIALAPAGLPLGDAGALPLAGLTALQALHEGAVLAPGRRLAVVGASGGVGHLAVQIGRALGAHVAGVCGRRSFDFVRSLGAQDVYDYADPTTCSPSLRFDVVFDAVAKAGFIRWKSMLASGGTVVTVNPVVGRVLPTFVTGLIGVPHLRSIFVRPEGEGLKTLAAMVAAGAVRPHIARRFALSEVADAHRLSEQGHVQGKLVIDVSPQARFESAPSLSH